MACRKIDSTTMIRVNEVIMMTIDGKKVSAVIKTKICRVKLYSWEPSGLVVMVTADRPPVCAHSEGATRHSNNQYQLPFMVAPGLAIRGCFHRRSRSRLHQFGQLSGKRRHQTLLVEWRL